MKNLQNIKTAEIFKASAVWPVKKWLAAGFIALALLSLVLSRAEMSSAHSSYPTATHTPTPTPTRPALQACQVSEMIFDQTEYQVGDTIQLTVWVEHQGAPLVGANADVEVIRQPLNAQAINLPNPLEDQSGSYVGDYVPELPGDYTFKVTVNDPTGTRFRPCAAQRTVRVNAPRCQITLASDKSIYDPNESIALTANLTVGGVCQPGAVVTATVRRPNGSVDSINFGGSCPYAGLYSNAGLPGTYQFEGFARDPQGRFLSCVTSSHPLTVAVKSTIPPPCQISPIQLSPDKSTYNINDTVNVKVTVTNTSNIEASVTTVIRKPDNTTETITLSPIGNMMYGRDYTLVMSGTYRLTATARDLAGQNFSLCTTPEKPVPVTPTPPLTTTVKVDPSLREIDLCGQVGDTSSRIRVEGVSNLASIQLELSYDPSVIQVIDADRNQQGVQVGFNPILTPSENRVDTRMGRIFFRSIANPPINGASDLITVNWRAQRGPGSSPVTITHVDLKNTAGQTISVTPQHGLVRYLVGQACRLQVGQAILQGRADHSGITVANPAGQQTQTNEEGYFFIVAGGDLNLTIPGYLPGQADEQVGLQVATPEGQVIDLGLLNLMAGDINGDNIIDILDLVTIAGRYQSNDPTADLNGNDLVDILDLALVAGNYGQQGPIMTWSKD